MSGETPRWAVLARIVRPQGRRGEVLAELLTDFPETLAGRKGLYLGGESFDGAEDEARPCRIEAAWRPTGKNAGRVVLAIAGVTTMDGAAELAGLDVLVRTSARMALEDGSLYLSDLAGCRVFDREHEVGTVREVQFPTSADGRKRLEDAAPLLVVDRTGSPEPVLIPFVKEFLLEMDADQRLLRMQLPEGLLDLESPATAENGPGSGEPV